MKIWLQFLLPALILFLGTLAASSEPTVSIEECDEHLVHLAEYVKSYRYSVSDSLMSKKPDWALIEQSLSEAVVLKGHLRECGIKFFIEPVEGKVFPDFIALQGNLLAIISVVRPSLETKTVDANLKGYIEQGLLDSSYMNIDNAIRLN